MGKPVNRPPEGAHNLTQTLIVRGGFAALAFYEQVFAAQELTQMRMLSPGGKKVVHIEFEINGCLFLLKDEFPVARCFSPESPEGEALVNHIQFADVEAIVNKAELAGATVVSPISPQTAGVKAKIRDPFGHFWIISSSRESLTPEENARLQADFSGRFSRSKKVDRDEG